MTRVSFEEDQSWLHHDTDLDLVMWETAYEKCDLFNKAGPQRKARRKTADKKQTTTL